MKQLLIFLSGKKTFIISSIGLIYVLATWLGTGEFDKDLFQQSLLGISLRLAIK